MMIDNCRVKPLDKFLLYVTPYRAALLRGAVYG